MATSYNHFLVKDKISNNSNLLNWSIIYISKLSNKNNVWTQHQIHLLTGEKKYCIPKSTIHHYKAFMYVTCWWRIRGVVSYIKTFIFTNIDEVTRLYSWDWLILLIFRHSGQKYDCHSKTVFVFLHSFM